MEITWSDVGAILAGMAAGALVVTPAITFARRPRLRLTADAEKTWTRIESDGAVYVRGLVHCSRLTREAREARVLVESYRPKGSGHHATTLGGTPSLGWPSAQDGTDGSLTVHPGATRAIDLGGLFREMGLADVYPPPGRSVPSEPWRLQLTLAAGLRLTDRRDVLEPGAWTIRLLVVADDAKTRTYDVDISWNGGASDAQDVFDSLSVEVEPV